MASLSLFGAPEGGEPVRVGYVTVNPIGEKVVNICEGDLILFCNVLDDYARILDTYTDSTPELDAVKKSHNRYYADRFRERSNRVAAAIGYDKEAAAERCRKAREKSASKDDVGEDALVLALKKAKAKEKAEAVKAGENNAAD